MKRIPDKVIISLLATAIMISLVATLIGLSKMGEIGITGKATSTGTGEANLTITALTEITNRNATLNWSAGYVNESYTNCTLNTEGAGDGCVGFANLTRGFLLENTGNLNISVNYSASGAAADFIGGSEPSPEFKIKLTANSAAGQTDDSTVDTTASCLGNWTPSAYEAVTINGAWICGNWTNYTLSPSNDRDAAVVDIQVLIPANAPIGAKNVTLTFNAHSSG